MQQITDILKAMKATREEFIKPYNENSIEYIKTKESILTIDEMIFKLGALGDGWIPVTPESMPDEYGYYLTWGDNLNVFDGKPRVMYYEGGFFECGDGAELPTHWKPIYPPQQ